MSLPKNHGEAKFPSNSNPDPDPSCSPPASSSHSSSNPAHQDHHLALALAPATLALHSDDHLHQSAGSSDIAPPIHVSTNFDLSEDDDLQKIISGEGGLMTPQTALPPPTQRHVYSRESSPNTTRLEAILSSLLGGNCVTYSSGLAALHAAYVFLQPRRIAIGQVYFGSHGVVRMLHRGAGVQILPLDGPATDLQQGDVIHLETPINPSGLALDISKYARKAHSRGAYLLVDGTFAPPGLQDPFLQGADMVFHSGTKYLGGHGDLLCGVLAVREGRDSKEKEGEGEGESDEGKHDEKSDWITQLKTQRVHLGSVMGALEAWLAVRSLRTLTLRVRRQSDSAGELVAWLHESLQRNAPIPIPIPPTSTIPNHNPLYFRTILHSIQHASFQPEAADPNSWLRAQMPNGYGPVFALVMRTETLARRLPSRLRLWRNATSLGGVESLVDWRVRHDPGADGRVLRFSVGLEEACDLRADLERGFGEVGMGEGGERGESKL